MTETSEIYQQIYTSGLWGSSVIPNIAGGSGNGSSESYAKPYMNFLTNFMEKHNIKSIVDLGCGDWQFSRHMNWNDRTYIGIDCVAPVIAAISKQFSKENVSFQCTDFEKFPDQIPNGDLLVIKDVLQHWPNELITKFLKYVIEAKKFKYILITNCHQQPQFRHCLMGEFFPLDPNLLPLSEFEPSIVLEFESKKTCLIVSDNITNRIEIKIAILESLKVYQFDNKIRLGVESDGGYVIGNIDTKYDCYISAGIAGEESFSRDFINKYNMNKFNSFGFDGTINDYPYHYTNDISFIKKNINCFNDNHNTNLSFLIEKYNNIFLKMDIEGGEFVFLLGTDESQLSNFKQIVIEIHGITNDKWGANLNVKLRCLQKLSNTHYLIHAHGNNNGLTVNGIPEVIELTYLNKNCFIISPELNTVPLPISNLDFRNTSYANEIDLNIYPFVVRN